MTCLIDTNVLFDIVLDDAYWAEKSLRALRLVSHPGPLLINVVIYAELSVSYGSLRQVDDMLAAWSIALVDIPRQAGFVAGKAFKRYRAAGGIRTGVLPDFFIGAHAEVADLPLLTRDPKRYRTYFPSVELIVPEH